MNVQFIQRFLNDKKNLLGIRKLISGGGNN